MRMSTFTTTNSTSAPSLARRAPPETRLANTARLHPDRWHSDGSVRCRRRRQPRRRRLQRPARNSARTTQDTSNRRLSAMLRAHSQSSRVWSGRRPRRRCSTPMRSGAISRASPRGRVRKNLNRTTRIRRSFAQLLLTERFRHSNRLHETASPNPLCATSSSEEGGSRSLG